LRSEPAAASVRYANPDANEYPSAAGDRNADYRPDCLLCEQPKSTAVRNADTHAVKGRCVALSLE